MTSIVLINPGVLFVIYELLCLKNTFHIQFFGKIISSSQRNDCKENNEINISYMQCAKIKIFWQNFLNIFLTP